MSKISQRCPSCDEETYAGRYCVHCGAVLQGRSARYSEDVIDEIADAVIARVKEKLEKTGEKNDAKETKKSDSESESEPRTKRGLFRPAS